MGKCLICGKTSKTVSNTIGVCSECLRKYPEKALSIAMRPHIKYRKLLGLPLRPPRRGVGTHHVKCSLCVNECEIPEGGKGYCGLWVNKGGKLRPLVGYDRAIVFWYLDPLPTNCVATPVCPAATGRGFPKYSVSRGPEYGYFNLAVFFGGCSLDCLFCQNWEHKEMITKEALMRKYVRNIEELVELALNNDRISCICFFGGDPGPQALYAIKASRVIIRHAEKRGLVKRICWETNGLENPLIMKEMARLSLVSGGIVKIDWKAWTPSIYQALTGIDGYKAVSRVKENIKLVNSIYHERPEVPLLVVSTLLVPGYVDEHEVKGIATFLSSLNPEIPYVLLAFHPDHLLRDLPPTSITHARSALRVARSAGLKHVFLGNEWLLGNYY